METRKDKPGVVLKTSRIEAIKFFASIAFMFLAACGGEDNDPPPLPAPEGIVILKASASNYSIDDYYGSLTAPLEELLDFAEATRDRLNEIITTAGVDLLNADELDIMLEFKNSQFTINGELYSRDVEGVDVDDLVHFMIKDQSSKWEMQGGHVWVKRALLNSQMLDLDGLLQDIEAGVDYSFYKGAFKLYDKLIAGDITLEEAGVSEDEFARVQEALAYVAIYPHLLTPHAREQFNLIAILSEAQGVDVANYKLTDLVCWMEDLTLFLAIKSPGAVDHKNDNLGELIIEDWFSFKDTSYLELNDGTRIHLGALLDRLFLTEMPSNILDSLSNTLVGTDHDETLIATDTHYNLDGGGGDDILIGNGLNNHLIGGAGNDRLEGHAGDDNLEGGEGDDVLLGGANDDLLKGGPGADDLQGGEDSDTASYQGSSGSVTIDLGAGTASGGDAEGDLLNSIESFIGS